MNFIIYRINNVKKLNTLVKHKRTIIPKKNEIDLFHLNEIKTDFFHMVFHVADEYHFGTRKIGKQINVPFSQYINCFLSLNNPYFIVESIHEYYTKAIIEFIEQKSNSNINSIEISNKMMLLVGNKLDGYVKNIQYTDLECEEHELDSLHLNQINLDNLKEIYSILYNVKNKFVSLNKNGTISVNNSEEKYLINFTEEILNVFKNN